MGMAPVAHVLFTRFAVYRDSADRPPSPVPGTNKSGTPIRFFNANPKSSKWFNRDRFVLSNG